MNAFVRDAAVNRKRRARQSLSARNTEPERKKIHKTDDDGATPAPRYHASSSLQIYSGESPVDQSKVVATEKESRYLNVEFMRAKAFSYLNFKKISASKVNKLLKEHLKKYDKNESHLKRTFEQCYDVTGSVEKSKAMMKQLATISCVRLDLKTNLSSEVDERRLSILPRKGVKKLKKINYTKGMNIHLKKKIDDKNLIFFGKYLSSKDKKILYTEKINDYNKAPILNYDSDSTVISDAESNFMGLTTSYSLHNTKIDTCEVTQVTEPTNCAIVRIDSNLRKDNLQSSTFCDKKSISKTTRLKNSVHNKFKKGPNVCDTGNCKIAASNINNVGEMINSQLNTDASIQNAERFALETANYVGQVIVPQFEIDGSVKNSKVSALEANADGENTVPHKNSEVPVLAQNIDDEEMMVPPLIINEFIENSKSNTVLETDVGRFMVPKLIIDETVQYSNSNALETNDRVGEIIDPEVEKSTSTQDLVNSQINTSNIDTDVDDSKKQSALESDDEEFMVPKLIIDETVQYSNSNALETNGLVIEIIDLEVEKSTSTQDLVNSQINTSNIDTDVDDSKKQSALESDDEEFMVPKLIIDETVQYSNSNALETNGPVGEIVDLEVEKSTSTQDLVNSQINTSNIDTDVDDSKKQSALESDDEEFMVPKLIIDETVQYSNSNALETNGLVIEIIDLEVEKSTNTQDLVNSRIYTSNIDTDVDVSKKQSALKTDDEEFMVPKLIIDETVQYSNSNALETNGPVGEIIDLEVEKSTGTQDLVNSQINTSNIDTDVDVLKKQSALETDDEEFMVPKLIIDETVQYSNNNALETNGLVGEIIDPEVEKSTSTQDLVNSQINTSDIDTDVDVSKKQSALETDDEEFMVPKLIIDETVQYSNNNALETNGPVREIIYPEVEKSTSTRDLVNSQINALKISTDIDDSNKQSEILDHTNIVLKIRKIINPDDIVFENSMIKDLATYFLNDDFLSKVDALWKTIESELVGELIINLLMMFNDKEYNMAQLTGCLICIFREIAQKSSILPCQLKLKLIVFLDAIKKYIKFHDNALWRTWFVPSMFFDWCFIVAFIFMGTKNGFKIDVNKSVIRNATAYYKRVKQRKYQFIHQDLEPSKSHKKSGIFELTRIDDLLEIDDLHATIDTKVVPNISINIPSNEHERKTDDNSTETNNSIPENIEDIVPTPELTRNDDLEMDVVHTAIETEVLPNISINKPLNEHKHKKLKTDDNCIETINNYIPENIEDMVPTPAEPKISKLKVRSQFNYSNSFITKLDWFNGNVSELMKKFKVSTSKESIESSTVQNSTTVVGNNKGPSSVNKRGSATNIPTKSKKSKTQVGSPRVFFTIADNPREFDITYGSSAIAQNSRSSVVSNVSSSTVSKYSSSSAAVSQSLGSSTVSQTLPPYYNHYSSSYTSSQLPVTSQTVVPRNLSVYYNNFTSNITQVPIGLQTMPSLSNTTQSSDARSTNSSVNVNVASIIHPLHSINQQAIHHQSSAATNSQLPKAANTWPSNKYTNMCSDPSCSKSSTCHTQYTNSAPSYSHSPYYYNIPSATSHPRYSNALTYPSTYTNPLVSNLLASNTANVASMNTYTQQTNYDYRSSHLSQNKSKTLDHNTQVSPDLPDARLPNMPNNQAADINKTCMAANCTNFSSFSCNTCLTAFYCSIQCQKSDWHYHQNECCVSF